MPFFYLFIQEIFFFKEGSVIFWNVPELERSSVLKFLAKHAEDAYDEDLGNVGQLRGGDYNYLHVASAPLET